MADDDFDAVLDKYFAWPGTWDLFTAICLMQKIDPATRTKPIKHDMPTDDPDGGTDYTIRPYKIALEAIQEAKSGRRPAKNEAPNLIEVEYKAEEIGAKRHHVNPRNFVAWAHARWSYATKHLDDAEERYRKAKEMHGLKSGERKPFAQKAFWKMVEEEKLDVSRRRGKTRKWARMLEARLTPKGKAPLYDSETLRKYIPDWIDELG